MNMLTLFAVCNLVLITVYFFSAVVVWRFIHELKADCRFYRNKLIESNEADRVRLDTERKQWTNAALVRGGGSKIFRDESDKPKPVLNEIERDEAEELADLPPFTARVAAWRSEDELKKKPLVPAAIKADLEDDLDRLASAQNN